MYFVPVSVVLGVVNDLSNFLDFLLELLCRLGISVVQLLVLQDPERRLLRPYLFHFEAVDICKQGLSYFLETNIFLKSFT